MTVSAHGGRTAAGYVFCESSSSEFHPPRKSGASSTLFFDVGTGNAHYDEAENEGEAIMEIMDETAKKIRAELDKSLEQIHQLLNEVRLKAHLAKMDVKDRWQELEPRVKGVIEQAAKSASDASRTAVDEAIQALEKLRSSLP